ncbi:MAG: DUF1475 family protein [Anaerolineales bacterium]|nr:DUF1475 family protein [Anaerolineales bacterium]
MKIAKWIAFAGILAMAAVLVYGFSAGNFSSDGGKILTNPWGIVSLVDLYTGFVLFSLWIVHREEKWWQAAIWVVLMMVLGFFTGALYTFLAVQQSGGNQDILFHGKNIKLSDKKPQPVLD